MKCTLAHVQYTHVCFSHEKCIDNYSVYAVCVLLERYFEGGGGEWGGSLGCKSVTTVYLSTSTPPLSHHPGIKNMEKGGGDSDSGF